MSENEDPGETNPRRVSSEGDPPIRKKKEDHPNRARFAEALAEQMRMCQGPAGWSLVFSDR